MPLFSNAVTVSLCTKLTDERHSFSIVIASKNHVNRITLGNEQDEEVMVEGELGKLIELKFIEGILLEISGENGVLRIDLTEKELVQGLEAKK